MATFPFTRPGVPADIVEKCFLGLHRCDELPLELWIGMITDAYNLATAIAAAPSYDARASMVMSCGARSRRSGG